MMDIPVGLGFNRYIVECKLTKELLIYELGQCFNRYIVECKLDYCKDGIIAVLVLIDT